MQKLEFPKGFLWGSATASYQIEGWIDNNDWALEARNGRVPDAGQATNHRQLYESDLHLLSELKQNAYRFSIEWARIEPEEGKFDQQAIGFYRNLIVQLKSRGITPFVTLWHFTLPEWFYKMGGFQNKKAIFYFSRYVKYVWDELAVRDPSDNKAGERAEYWMSINEPMVYVAEGYLEGTWPPFKKNIFNVSQLTKTLISSHLTLCDIKRKEFPSIKLGIAKNNCYYQANPVMKYFHNTYFLNRIASSLDFIGLNYYFPHLWPKNPHKNVSDMGWEIYPEGIYHVLKDLKRYGLPVYITENGLADADDSRREQYIKRHLLWAHRAMQEGVDLRGYFYWSLLDNFEWVHGFKERFGLVEVDYKTFARKIRPSALEYAKICEENTLTL
ncbi:MAG: glycoside hydrolase family 1 protein [bacterium]|nr:glycoside hydrolase family 1 protein [bacterium]